MIIRQKKKTKNTNNNKKKSFEIKENLLDKEKNIIIIKILKKRKLINVFSNIQDKKCYIVIAQGKFKYGFLSVPGSHNGAQKKNQDCYLILPKINVL